jgi:predicted amidophosphoribosyltransferase
MQGILELVLPRVCIGCNLSLEPGWPALCSACTARLPGRLRRRCEICAAPMIGQQSDHGGSLCRACSNQQPAFDATFTLCSYRSPIDEMVQALKFGRRWSLGKSLGHCLGQQIGSALLAHAQQLWAQRADARTAISTKPLAHRPKLYLCAIPLSSQRFVERGFNQSQLILSGLRQALERCPLAANIDVVPANLLDRIRHTDAQTLVSPERRHDNVRRSFAARRPCEQAVIVLIDDVMTSGATLSNAALTLKSAGAFAVINAVLARTDP